MSRAFSTIATGVSGSQRFEGATTVGDLVVFAPYDLNSVGVFDPSTSRLSSIDISNTISGQAKFDTVVAADNGLLVFVPYSATKVGV